MSRFAKSDWKLYWSVQTAREPKRTKERIWERKIRVWSLTRVAVVQVEASHARLSGSNDRGDDG